MENIIMFESKKDLCLRQGYNCKCGQCQIWIKRWEVEFNAWKLIDSMIESGKSLFQIYERLRAEHPLILAQHHKSIEQQFIDRYKANEKGED